MLLFLLLLTIEIVLVEWKSRDIGRVVAVASSNQEERITAQSVIAASLKWITIAPG